MAGHDTPESANEATPGIRAPRSDQPLPTRRTVRAAAEREASLKALPDTGPATGPATRLATRASGDSRPRPAPASRGRAKTRVLRSAATIGLVVPALLGTLALPAYALQAEAAGSNTVLLADAQSLTVSPEAVVDVVSRDTYSATTADELAAERAAEEAKRAAATAGSSTAYTGDPNDEELKAFVLTSPGWFRPLDVPISSGYGPRSIICNGAGCSTSFHYGTDFPTSCGTPIRAVAAGRVTFIGSGGSFGNQVILDHGNGVESVYGHLDGVYPVAMGQLVEAGAHVANVGATGVVTACHLDLKIRVNGEHTDAAVYLRERGVAI